MDSVRTLSGLFVERAKQYPDNIAVEHCDEKFTYKYLLEASKSFSRILKAKSSNNPFVVLYLPPSISHILATLSTLFANKIIVPIHEYFTKSQFEICMSRFQNPLVITNTEQWKKNFNISYNNVYFIDKPEESIYCNQIYKFDTEDLNDVRYVFTTSGTTGTPKILLHREAGIVKLTKALIARDQFAFTQEARGILGIATSVSLTLMDIWTIFGVGGTIVIPPDQIKLDVESYRRWICDSKITIASFPSLVLNSILSENVHYLMNLKRIGYTNKSTRTENFQMLKNVTFVDVYGATEMYIATIKEVKGGTTKHNSSVGVPVSDTTIYLIDDEGNRIKEPLKKGIIHVSSCCLAKGYFDQPKLTSKFFKTNPFGNNNYSRMYNTGDIGYFDEAGELFMAGREDHQVKIHGIRLELEDVESGILKYPTILEAIVIPRNIGKVTQLIAFCILRPNSVKPSTTLLHNFLSDILPRHAIPSSFQFLDKFPTTASGKVDRRSLGKLISTEMETELHEGDTEKLVRMTWEDVLGIPVKMSDNFFYLGGNSMMAYQVIGKLLNKSINTKVENLFKHPTLKDFVECLSETNGNVHSPEIDWNKEIQLDMTKSSAMKKLTQQNFNRQVRGILITGASGFLGSCIVVELIKLLKSSPSAKVYCLVRGKDRNTAEQRLKQILKSRCYVNDETSANQIIVIAGDASKENFGLSVQEYNDLAENIDKILHVAAEVNFMKTFEQLRETTVAMTRRVINFAMSGLTAKEIHLISTVSVFEGVQIESNTGNIYTAYETILPGTVHPSRMKGAYSQSKWVCEQLVNQATLEYGIPVSIYRVGQVGMHFLSKTFNEKDAIVGFVQQCEKLGCFPKTNLHIPLIDAESVSKAIAYLTCKEKGILQQPEIFHCVGSHVKLNEFFDNLECLSFQEFETKFNDKFDETNPLNENEIRAWAFLKMIRTSQNSNENEGDILRNVRFHTLKTKEAIGNIQLRATIMNHFV